MQKYETAFAPFEHCKEEDFEDGLKILDYAATNFGEENLFGLEYMDENGVNNLADVESDEEEGEDYELFAEMLSEGRKAIEERKRFWEETGDSFILDHFRSETRVDDWVKENLITTELDMDISTVYGNQCKQKKLHSTFLEKEAPTLPTIDYRQPVDIGFPRTPSTTINPSKTVRSKSESKYDRRKTAPSTAINQGTSVKRLSMVTESPASIRGSLMDIAVPRTPTTTYNPSNTAVSKSESTYDRRKIAPRTAIKRGMFQSVKRLSTVPESPSRLQASPIRRSYSISDLKLPRQRTVIYSPMNPIVHEKFKAVLAREWFDPNKTLIYEPPSDANSSSESDDDILMTCKRKFGGKIHEI